MKSRAWSGRIQRATAKHQLILGSIIQLCVGFNNGYQALLVTRAGFLDIGCYQPAIGFYAARGWREVIGIAKEEGECNWIASYSTESGTKVRNFILDVEVESISEASGSLDVVLMMEVLAGC